MHRLNESRKLVKVTIRSDGNKHYKLSWEGKTSFFYGDAKAFRRFLIRLEASDVETEPRSRMNAWYSTIVGDLDAGNKKEMWIWDSYLKDLATNMDDNKYYKENKEREMSKPVRRIVEKFEKGNPIFKIEEMNDIVRAYGLSEDDEILVLDQDDIIPYDYTNEDDLIYSDSFAPDVDLNSEPEFDMDAAYMEMKSKMESFKEEFDAFEKDYMDYQEKCGKKVREEDEIIPHVSYASEPNDPNDVTYYERKRNLSKRIQERINLFEDTDNKQKFQRIKKKYSSIQRK